MPLYNVISNKRKVLDDTWGHFKPKRTCYTGYITFYLSEYREYGVLSTEIDIPDSPWWYECLMSLSNECTKDMEEGTLLKIKIRVYPRKDKETFRVQLIKKGI